MKVDVISTRLGDFIIEYSTFTKKLFISKYPDELDNKSGIHVKKGRDEGFNSFDEVKQYVSDVIENYFIKFNFKRKVIFYKISTYQTKSDGEFLSFKYMICNESDATYSYAGGKKFLNEYSILENNMGMKNGYRNILGQIFYGDELICIDYSEEIHKFIVDFLANFQQLKNKLVDFFDKDKFIENVKISIENKQKLLG